MPFCKQPCAEHREMPLDYSHFDEIGDDAPPLPIKVRKQPHRGPAVVREDFDDDISAYIDGGLPVPAPPPLTDAEKRDLVRKSKEKFRDAKAEFGTDAVAHAQLRLAARTRCVYGPGAPGAPCDGGRARVEGGEDLSTWDAAAKAAQIPRTQMEPVPDAPEVAALRDQVAKGDADAQAALGARLYEGSGCERNPAQAEHFLRLAAAQHHARAAFDLGEAYSRSVEDGLRLDPAEARKWFRRAAKAGHAGAKARAAFLDELFAEAAQAGEEKPIFDDDAAQTKTHADDAAAAAAAAGAAQLALEGPPGPGVDRTAIREATEALRALEAPFSTRVPPPSQP